MSERINFTTEMFTRSDLKPEVDTCPVRAAVKNALNLTSPRTVRTKKVLVDGQHQEVVLGVNTVDFAGDKTVRAEYVPLEGLELERAKLEQALRLIAVQSVSHPDFKLPEREDIRAAVEFRIEQLGLRIDRKADSHDADHLRLA